MKLITAAAVALLLGGCATMQPPKPAPKAAKVVKYKEPCSCSPTASEVVKNRWYSGWKVKVFH